MTMKLRLVSLSWAIILAPTASLLGSSKPPEIDLKVDVSVPKPAVVAGSEGEAVMTLTPPPGIKINQYPPIRLTLEQNPPVTFRQPTMKIGLDKMPSNPEQNPFKKIDPIRMKFRVGRHDADDKIQIRGKLRFFYCVAKSGYCAPGTKEVSFNVPVMAGP